jgi:outer membrane lipoprotein-sorting protein
VTPRLLRRAAVAAGLLLTVVTSTRARGQPTSGPDDARRDRLIGEIAKARSSLKTLVGPFTQTRTIGLLSAKVRSTGTMTLVRPDRLRWELAPPDEIVYWVTPEGLAYRSREGSGSVRGSTAKVAASLDDMRVLLGGDLAELSSRYDLTVSGPDAGPFTFDAAPRVGMTAAVQHLTFTIAADRVTPVRAVLVEGPKDRTEIDFGTLAKNVAVDPALVRPPP